MIGSLNTGYSGVRSHTDAMTVTGSNIANANTVGYKAHRAEFGDVMASAFGEVGDDLGQGSVIQNVKTMHTQGSFESTKMDTDMAIDGGGFFVVKDEQGKTYFSRAGNFKTEKDGTLVTADGHQVMVKDVDRITGESVGDLKSIDILNLTDPPMPTGDGVVKGTGLAIKANLSGEAQPPEMPIDLDNIQQDMYNFSVSHTVYDELGSEHPITVAFRKLPDIPPQIDAQGQPIPGTEQKNVWSWYALTMGEAVKEGTPGLVQAQGGGFLQFSEDGRLVTTFQGRIVQPEPVQQEPAQQGQPAPPPIPQPKTLVRVENDPNLERPQIALNWTNTDNPTLLGLDFGDGFNPTDPTDSRDGLDGLTQFSGASDLDRITADGNPFGTISNIEVEANGTIQGIFDSGEIKPIGRLMLAEFQAPEELAEEGLNLYKESFYSGDPTIGDPGSSQRGFIHNRTLEKSTVDLANEFVRMIEQQRGFQANAKTVTTSDEILSDTIGLKR